MSENINIDCRKYASEKVVSPALFGYNTEITRRGSWMGLSAQMVNNRKFAVAEPNGMPKRWMAVGDGDAVRTQFFGGYSGANCAVITVSQNVMTGIAQQESSLNVTHSGQYALRLVLASEENRRIAIRLIAMDETVAAEHVIAVNSTSSWQTFSATLQPTASGAMRLEILSDTPGVFRIGAVSLMPADAKYGIRSDVVECLKSLHPYALRFPGGCYAEYYRWKDGLKDADMRPSVGPTGLPFLLPENDDYDCQDIGIVEFLWLCREVGCQPAVTVRTNETAPEDAFEMVQFCNGAIDTPLGHKRAEFGLADAPKVHTWFIGNELWSFGHHGLNTSEGCAQMTRRFAEAMRRADASANLIGCTFYDKSEWNEPVAKHAGDLLDGYSMHMYVNDWFRGTFAELAYTPETVLRPMLTRVRDIFRRCSPQQHRIVFDEWNLRWGSVGTVGMGVYVAGVLNMLCRQAEELDIQECYYFMAINEGIIDAVSRPAKLDIAGLIFDMARNHAGQRLLEVPTHDTALDVTASVSEGGTPCITILNRNVSATIPVKLTLSGYAGNSLTVTYWEPLLPDINARNFKHHTEILSLASEGELEISLKPAAFVKISG